MNLLSSYPYLVAAFGSLAFIMLAQLLVADIVGIRSKHIPGTSVVDDHKSLLFRVGRTVANTNESIAIFILASAFCVACSASPFATGICAWVYVIARLLYALCYYMDWRLMRSVIFGISLLALGALVIIGTLGFLAK